MKCSYTNNERKALLKSLAIMIKSGKWESAVGPLQSAIGDNPLKPEAFNLLGAVYEKRGDYSTARKFYRAGLSIDPSYVPTQNNLNRLVENPDILQVFGSIDLGF